LINGEGAVDTGGGSVEGKAGAVIDIACGDQSGCGEGQIFLNSSELLSTGDDGSVIGASDGDGNGLGGGATEAIVNRDGEGFGECFA
jgi:hypothetical protein